MSTETETKTEEKPDAKVANMLKALGYFDDVDQQAKLPDDDEDKSLITEDIKTDEAAKPAEGAAAVEGTDKAAETTADTKAEKKEEVAAKSESKSEEKVEDGGERARKVTQKKSQVTIDDIVGAVKTAVAEEVKQQASDTKKKEEAAPTVDETFRKSLHPAELKALELAENAQRLLGEKYKDQAAKEVEWIRAHRQRVNEIVKENGKFDPNDEDYVQFVRANRPTIPQHDREEIFLAQAEERAAARVTKAMEKQIAERDRAIAELKFQPVIDQVGEVVKNEVLAAAGEEFAKAFNETPGTVSESFPLEAPIVATAVAEAVVVAKEYMALVKGLKQPDEHGNRMHKQIIDFIGHQGKIIDDANAGGKPYTREGRTLVSREKYYTLLDQGKDVSKLTTLEDADIIKMMTYAAKTRIESNLATEKKRFEALTAAASKKSSPPPAEKKAEVKVEAAPPKGGTGPGKGAKPSSGPAKTIPPHFKALGYDGA